MHGLHTNAEAATMDVFLGYMVRVEPETLKQQQSYKVVLMISAFIQLTGQGRETAASWPTLL